MKKKISENFNLRYQVVSETLKNRFLTLKSTFLSLGPPNLTFWYKMGYLFTHFWNFWKMLKIGPFLQFLTIFLAFSDFRVPRGPRKSNYAEIGLKNFLFLCFFWICKNIKNLVLKKIWFLNFWTLKCRILGFKNSKIKF